MMYKAGPVGQVFEREQLPKIRKIREEYLGLPITAEGGIDRKTVPMVVDNGATRLVVNSYLFAENKDRIAEAIEELRNI